MPVLKAPLLHHMARQVRDLDAIEGKLRLMEDASGLENLPTTLTRLAIANVAEASQLISTLIVRIQTRVGNLETLLSQPRVDHCVPQGPHMTGPPSCADTGNHSRARSEQGTSPVYAIRELFEEREAAAVARFAQAQEELQSFACAVIEETVSRAMARGGRRGKAKAGKAKTTAKK